MESYFGGVLNPSIDVSVIENDIIALDVFVVVVDDESDHRLELLHKHCASGSFLHLAIMTKNLLHLVICLIRLKLIIKMELYTLLVDYILL